jgi:PE family
MTSTPDLWMQPAEVVDASRQLDELAGRAEKLMQAEEAHLTVRASSRDEVSQQVAATLNDVHTEFRKSTDEGIGHLREIAATLRAHTDNVIAAEQDFVV